MIEGIKLDFTSQELRAIAEERRDYHLDRARFYREQAGSLKDGIEAEPDASNQYATGDPVRALQHSEREHSKQAAFFDVVAAHVVIGEMYRLDERDLARMEFDARFAALL